MLTCGGCGDLSPVEATVCQGCGRALFDVTFTRRTLVREPVGTCKPMVQTQLILRRRAA